jgi:hypothetical protein
MLFRNHHDDDPYQYRFGLLPQPLKAAPHRRVNGRVCQFGIARSRTEMSRRSTSLREVTLAGQAI